MHIVANSDSAKNNAFAYTSDGTSDGTWFRKTAGVPKTQDFVASGDWNGSHYHAFNPAYGNSYEVEYTYGYGVLVYKVLNPNTTRYETVHTIKYAEANKSSPMFGNPSLRCGLYAASLGGTEPITVKCSDISNYVQGNTLPTRNPRSFGNDKIIGQTLTNIFSIRNRGIVNGYFNQVELQLMQLTMYTDSNRGAEVRIIGNATVAGTRNWQQVGSSNLSADYDVSGTTVTEGTGRLLGTYTVGRDAGLAIDLWSLFMRVPPSLTITVAGKVVQGSTDDIAAALVWYEDV